MYLPADIRRNGTSLNISRSIWGFPPLAFECWRTMMFAGSKVKKATAAKTNGRLTQRAYNGRLTLPYLSMYWETQFWRRVAQRLLDTPCRLFHQYELATVGVKKIRSHTDRTPCRSETSCGAQMCVEIGLQDQDATSEGHAHTNACKDSLD